ncbi:MAG: ABC transporter permease, partial [Chloroflexi bacterium]
QTLQYYNFDVAVFFARPYRIEQLQSDMQSIPSVQAADTWGAVATHRVRPDGSESDSILFAGPPVNTQMIRPILIEGRWLLPQDESAVVINTDLLRTEPDLRVGSTITLKVNSKDSQWTVVGIVKSVLMGPWAYANQPFYAIQTGQSGMASAIYLTIEDGNIEDGNIEDGATGLAQQQEDEVLRQAISQIETYLQDENYHFNSISSVASLKQATTLQFQVLTGFLMIMALMIALVGGLGLAGTMSLNIIERSREIGIMRAIGARNNTIHGIVIVEGIFIGGISWLLGGLLSYPLGMLLGDIIGTGFLQASLDDAFSSSGAFIWLAIILVLSALASLAPAYQATRFPIREVLAHE